jgi:hypothetical protein
VINQLDEAPNIPRVFRGVERCRDEPGSRGLLKIEYPEIGSEPLSGLSTKLQHFGKVSSAVIVDQRKGAGERALRAAKRFFSEVQDAS